MAQGQGQVQGSFGGVTGVVHRATAQYVKTAKPLAVQILEALTEDEQGLNRVVNWLPNGA